MGKLWLLLSVLVIALVIVVGKNYLPSSTPSPSLSQDCKIAGCNREICTEADKASDIVSDCEWKEEYACYKNARCEVQADTTCGWTQDETLAKCLEEARK